MTITYKWEVDMMHTKSDSNISDAIVEVHWSKHGTDENGIIGRYPGMSKFSIKDIDPNNFIPAKNLNKEDVLTWIQNTINKNHMHHIDTQIKNYIAFQVKDQVEKTMTYDEFPWVNT